MSKKLSMGLYIAGTLMIIWTLGQFLVWKYGGINTTDVAAEHYSAGWNQIDESWYYLGDYGHKMTGWIKDGEKFYYLKDDGSMSVGKVQIKDAIYEFDQKGALMYDSISDNTMLSYSSQPTKEKFETVPKYSWFEENGNTYFKMEKDLAVGSVNIDGKLYDFDENGVMLKSVIYTTAYGAKFLYGNNGENIEYSEGNIAQREWDSMAITTKSNTDNPAVKLDDSHMMDINEASSNGKIVNEKEIIASKDKSLSKVQVKGKTLYCKPKQTIGLGTIKISSTDANSTSCPNLVVSFESSDESIAYAGVEMTSNDGFFKEVHPRLLVYKPGKTTITLDVNGTQTSFDIVVSE